jgi:putative tricarboxylic transport membrane protein
MEHSMRKDKIISSVLVGLSVIYFLGCLNTKIGKIGNPGAGLIPWLISMCLFIFTGMNAIQIFKRHDDTAGTQPESPPRNRSAAIGIAIVILVYPLLLYTLKAVVATFASTFVLLRLMRYKSVPSSLVIALAVSASIYVVFGLILGVAFPSGPIEQLIWRLR